MHKTVIFDLGKVLIPFDFQIGYQALSGRCPYDSMEVRRRIGKTGLVAPFEKGLIEPRDFVIQLSAALELRMDHADFCRAWSSIFYGQLINDTVLESLSTRYRLLLLSNTNAIHWEIVRENYPMLRFFHDHVLSFRVHALKPDAAILQPIAPRQRVSSRSFQFFGASASLTRSLL